MDILLSATALTHLVCDARHPLISHWRLADEMLLYNIGSGKAVELIEDFFRISGKALTTKSRISELSGGQKVILMILLAIHSPAQRILFVDINHALDPEKYALLIALTDGKASGREFRFRNRGDVD